MSIDNRNRLYKLSFIILVDTVASVYYSYIGVLVVIDVHLLDRAIYVLIPIV